MTERDQDSRGVTVAISPMLAGGLYEALDLPLGDVRVPADGEPPGVRAGECHEGPRWAVVAALPIGES